MSTAALFTWLERASDRLSPIVVKEVRQIVRTREFASSFAASLIAALGIAFFGAADALSGSGTSGAWAFTALMTCLAFLGLAVVPLGAFNALRNERLEQTLELMTLTALSPRRVVIGKLLAQGVKLATFFAAIAPFIAMSFLLGGIDFVTILVSMLVLFLWSLWACAMCLFLSTLLKSRAMSGIVFGAVVIVAFLVLSFFMANRRAFGGPAIGFFGPPGSDAWWALAMTTSACLMTMVNLVLLAENRLSLPTEGKATALRVGFLAQFLLIVAWALPFADEAPRVQANAFGGLSVIAGLHLALVAIFAVTDDLVVSRRVFLSMQRPSRWNWLLALLRPGGGRGAAYVLAQFAILLSVARLFDPVESTYRWLLAICGYICCFTGLPTLALRMLAPGFSTPLKLRVAALIALVAALLLPDVVHYLVWRPDVLDLSFSPRHLFNPFRTLASWRVVEQREWVLLPLTFGLAGLLAYVGLIHKGWTLTMDAAPARQDGAAADSAERERAHLLY